MGGRGLKASARHLVLRGPPPPAVHAGLTILLLLGSFVNFSCFLFLSHYYFGLCSNKVPKLSSRKLLESEWNFLMGKKK